MKNNIFMLVAVAIIVGAVSFFAGMQYQKTQKGENNAQMMGRGQFGMRNGMGMNGRVNGDIISADEKSITVKLADGSSKIVLISDSTQINKAATAQKSDLKTGEKVAVFGTTNADGSITAMNVQLNPMLRGGISSTPSAN